MELVWKHEEGVHECDKREEEGLVEKLHVNGRRMHKRKYGIWLSIKTGLMKDGYRMKRYYR